MKSLLIRWLKAFLYPRPVLGILFLPKYMRDFFKFRKMDASQCVKWIDSYPCLLDQTISTPFDPHYFYQGAWLARLIAKEKPEYHVDVGSSVLTISVLSAMVKTIFVDYRPLQVDLTGFNSVGANITSLPFQDDSIPSLSCQHVIEHIGLGRYGDPIDSEGSVKAAKELERVLNPGGKLYLSLPVGRERVCFNAHRVHAPGTMIGLFQHMKLLEFSYVGDDGSFAENRSPSDVVNNEYACGMYVFEKNGSNVNRR